jgi:DNA polymerase III subunit gamma/tau
MSAAPAPPRPAPAAAADGAGTSVDWPALLETLDVRGAARELAANCVWVGREGATVRLALDSARVTARTRGAEDKLAQALGRHLGSPLRLEIGVTSDAAGTPARIAAAAHAARQAQLHATFEADPMVSALKQRFGAVVLPDSVQPLDSSD